MKFWRRLVRTLIVVCVLAGAGFSVAPVVEAVVAHHDDATTAAEAAAAAAGPDAWRAAEAYNADTGTVGGADPWSDEQAAAGPDHDRYVAALGGAAGPIGRIVAPSIGVDMPIWPDATRASLAKGAGHMYGTGLPVGGPGTHTVIAGHTGFVNRLYFDRLPDLAAGDVFFIDSAAGRLAYRVDRMLTVAPSDLSGIEPVPGADHATLLTCVGKNNSHRLLVRGTRTSIPEHSAPAAPAGLAASAGRVATLDWAWPRLATGAACLAVAGAACVHPRRTGTGAGH